MTWKNVLGMLMLVGLCVLALFLAQGSDPTGSGKPTTLLEPFVKDDVTGFSADGEQGAVEVRRHPDDSQRWDVKVGNEWARADGVRVDEILGAILRCEVRDSWPRSESSAADLATYGLDAPKTTLHVVLPSGERVARFGKPSREGGSVYTDRGDGTDVMLAAADASRLILQAVGGGLRDKRLTDLRTYDVKKIEIERKGVTTLSAEKDLSQIWRVSAPFKGYADPTIFETRLSNIVNEQWLRIVEDGAADLVRYGLDEPAAIVRLTSKRDVGRTLVLGTLGMDEGTRFAMEEGFHTVYLVSKRFVDAVLADPMDARDRSFSRLGYGVEAVTVNLWETSFVLRKAHTDWEIEKPAREPAEESEVEGLLEQLRQWPVLEFLDGEKPEDYGIEPDGPQVQIETEGGALTTLLIGKQRADGSYYAQRKDDGGVVVVLGAPVEALLKGWLQLKRRAALAVPIDDVDFIGRESGLTDEGQRVTMEKWQRDLDGADKSWRAQMGKVGAGLDAQAMNDFLDALRDVRAIEWLHADAHEREEMGFPPEGGKAATTWIEIGFRSDGLADVLLAIGARDPERDAYYAHQRGKPFVFLMSPDDVKSLTAPLTKPE